MNIRVNCTVELLFQKDRKVLITAQEEVERKPKRCYNRYIMKKEHLTFTVKALKTRAHYVLFCNNTPFKPKTVENKLQYKRQPKHKNKPEV